MSGASGRGYDWSYLKRGARQAASMPGVVMFFSFLGFGALLRSEGVPLVYGIAQDVAIWALPGQVVLLDAVSRGLPLLLGALAVTLTAVRLLPMVVLVLARSRLAGQARWPEYLAAHYIAATVWVMAEMHFDSLPKAGRLPWVIGLGTALVSAMTLATALGFMLTGIMAGPLAATLVFFTPAFFLLALIDGARMRMDWLAMTLGAVLGPLVHVYWPSLDLLAAGLVGGGAAFLLGRNGGGRAAS